MIIGVISFSFTTGSLASIISALDSRETELREKLLTLGDV